MAVTKLNLINSIINGSLEYWQRNTTFSAVATNTYTADRWMYTKVGTMVHTISQSSDVPSDAFGIYSMLHTVTTVPASIGASDYATMSQRIEGNIFRPLKGKKIILKFKVKAFKTGTYCVSFRNNAQDRSLVKEYTVNTSNTWETKIIRFQHDTSGIWVYDNGIGMRVNFILAAGSSLRTSPDVWVSGQYYATSNQVNGVDSLSNTFQIADICLVEDNDGQTRDPNFVLAGRNLLEELQLCQRYYEKLTADMRLDNSASSPTGSWQFKVTKRSTPVTTNVSGQGSVVISNINHASLGGLSNSTGIFGNGSTADAEL